mgnify:CR=1 FL=1
MKRIASAELSSAETTAARPRAPRRAGMSLMNTVGSASSWPGRRPGKGARPRNRASPCACARCAKPHAFDVMLGSQLGNGTFGGFDIAKQQYIGPFQLPDRNAGPRRISMDDNDVLYLALYGSGQLAEFDTKSRRMIGIHDLPDTGSAPYATTWDPLRRVVWIATSNGDVIYRFDPRDRKSVV